MGKPSAPVNHADSDLDVAEILDDGCIYRLCLLRGLIQRHCSGGPFCLLRQALGHLILRHLNLKQRPPQRRAAPVEHVVCELRRSSWVSLLLLDEFRATTGSHRQEQIGGAARRNVLEVGDRHDSAVGQHLGRTSKGTQDDRLAVAAFRFQDPDRTVLPRARKRDASSCGVRSPVTLASESAYWTSPSEAPRSAAIFKKLLVRETGRLAPRVADSAALLQAQRTTAAHIAVANGQEPRQSLH